MSQSNEDEDVDRINYSSKHIKDNLIVVLAGWLGCTDRALDKYARLYQGLGYSTLSVIAPPMTVIEASMQEYSPFMHQLANQVLCQLISSKISVDKQTNNNRDFVIYLVFHSFSNGGCFLYEQIRLILQGRSRSLKQVNTGASNVKIRMIGAVFDSSPAYYFIDKDGNIEGLERAMKYASKFDRIKFWFRNIFHATCDKEQHIMRARKYWDRMRNSSVLFPELYCYSDNDELAPYFHLNELIRYRKKSNSNVLATLFERSPHCCHLLTQPYMYSLVISNFLDLCQKEIFPDLQRSKL